MPIDQKRINAPEVTVPYQIYIDSLSDQIQDRKAVLKKRVDGRAHDEFRKMYVKINITSQAKGSAYIEMGQTKVVCSVFDPREIVNKSNYSTQGQLYCKFKFASFSCSKRKIHQQDAEEKEYSSVMQKALESAVCRDEFPNFQIDIYAVVLDNGGSALGAAIMAASLALANASVPMYGIVTAVTMGIYNDINIMDPTAEEESLCLSPDSKESNSINHGVVMQAMLPQHNQVSEFFFVGSIEPVRIMSVVELLDKPNNEICTILHQCIDKFIIKSLKRKNEVTENVNEP